MSRATVLIADDHAFILDMLVSLLKDDFDIVDTVRDGHHLVDAALRLRPDVAVTDISMPGLNGMEALQQLKIACPETKIIVLTMYVDAELADAAIRAGASGFVVKASAGEELSTAINEVLQDRIYVTPALKQG